ncbi:MAG: glycosyltransferase family 39 protein [bacterium]|nr:glycosyltransferase family 39 protein [bacterium]
MIGFLKKYEKLIVASLLSLMLLLGIISMRGDSAIVDEVAHIPAGYSYLKFLDYRLNPEHPPLIKDIAALPLLFLKLKFPTNISAWTTEPNGQWEVGWNFIYHIGNNADQIIFYSRLPILALAIIFGYVLYRFTKRRFGIEVGILTLFLYTFSANILAHARFVTTDLGIAAFIFFAFYAFFNFLEKPSIKTIWWAGFFLGLAQLAKFSAIMIYPLFGLLALITVIAWKKTKHWQIRLRDYLGGFIIISLISFILIWLFYIPHTLHMPQAIQDELIRASLPGKYSSVVPFLTKLNDSFLGKPLAQYLLGLAMVFNRVKSGNTTYLLGQVTNQSFMWYFPVTYLIKMPLSFLIISLGTIIYAVYQYFKKTPLKIWYKFISYANNHFIELSFILFIILYSYLSITGNLNLGIRHLFPIIPLIFILVSKKVVEFITNTKSKTKKQIYSIILAILLIWYGLSNIITHPSYVAYFNELIGGGGNAYKYVTDSNIDWGQDLKRLKEYADSNTEIDKIAVDYFGGGDPNYYFCKRKYDSDGKLIASASGYDCSGSKYVLWHADTGVFDGKYIAVSETYLMNDIYWSKLRGDQGYSWLRNKTPIKKIGNSIYIYKIK